MEIVLESPLKNDLDAVEHAIRTLLWKEAQKCRNSDPLTEDILSGMKEIEHEMEITQAAREGESLEESLRSDDAHQTLRTKLVLSVGTLPHVREKVEPLFERRNMLRKRSKMIQGFLRNKEQN